MAADWRFGDVVKPRDDRNFKNRRLMYVSDGEHPLSFSAICIREDPEDPKPIGVGKLGALYPNWTRAAFERVDA